MSNTKFKRVPLGDRKWELGWGGAYNSTVTPSISFYPRTASPPIPSPATPAKRRPSRRRSNMWFSCGLGAALRSLTDLTGQVSGGRPQPSQPTYSTPTSSHSLHPGSYLPHLLSSSTPLCAGIIFLGSHRRTQKENKVSPVVAGWVSGSQPGPDSALVRAGTGDFTPVFPSKLGDRGLYRWSLGGAGGASP